MSELYVVMWEEYDGYSCRGGDIYYSHDIQKATDYMHSHERIHRMEWDDNNDMYAYRSKYAWEKMYIDVRPMEEEL